MLGVPNPTIILATALGFVLATGGAYITGNLQGRKAADNIWQAKIAEQKAESGKVLAGALQKIRVKENQDAENARRIDEAHQAELALANAGRDAFANELRIARRRASCPNPGSAEASNTRVSANPTPVSDNGSGSPDPAEHLREAALELQRYAKACHSWAWQVGR